MTVGVNPPKTPVTEGSNGVAAATVPNVCKMPGPPAPFVPTPLPNIGKSDNSPKGYSTTVTFEGKAVAIKGATFNSMGDVASQGTGGGVVSNNVQGPTSFIAPGSLNVAIEGKNVQLLGDQMLNNCAASGSPANAATMAGVIQGVATPAFAKKIGDEDLANRLCAAACDAMNRELKPGQTRQNVMASHFSEGRPLYTATDPKILPEVSQRITSNGVETMMSESGRVVANTAVKAPMAMFKAMAQSTPASPVTRWDFMIPKNAAADISDAGNVSKYVEVKFPGDKLTENQKLARRRMGKERRKVVNMKPEKDCICSEKA